MSTADSLLADPMVRPKRIAVVGAGLMGHAIAYALAAAGHRIRVFDRSAEALDSLHDRLAAITDLLDGRREVAESVRACADLVDAASQADFAIETVTENLNAKQSLVAELEAALPEGAIIASNTSALPIGRIGEKAMDPGRIVGTHFWNPPHLVRLVEVVQAEKTSAETVERTIAFLSGSGYRAVHVRKDVPGFVGNRLQHALKREAIAIVAAGICDAETVDDVVKLGFGQRLGVLGPLEQSDMVGLDLTLAIHETLMPDIDRTDRPHPHLQNLVANGKLGMSAGEGFYTWDPASAESVRVRLRDHLLAQAKSQQS